MPTKNDALPLPAVVRGFNGFYKGTGTLVLMNAMRVVLAFAVLLQALIKGLPDSGHGMFGAAALGSQQTSMLS